MRLVINKRVIREPIDSILKVVKNETGFLDDIIPKRNDIVCTCPFHNDGHEKKAACFVNNDQSSNLEYGTFHCFACGESGSLAKLIGKCFGKTDQYGERWLIDHFGDDFIEEIDYLPPLITPTKKFYLDESYLDTFDYNNSIALDYLINKRKLSKDIIEKYKIGYDTQTNSVTFPLRDEHGKLLGVTKRNVSNKSFHIPREIQVKPVYLLDQVILNNESPVIVCESQINALTIRSWGMYSIALFGTGSKEQYKMLNRSGIRNYVLAFDGDFAGDVGANKFVNNVKNAITSQVIIPRGKDVNDLTREEFLSLEKVPR